MRNDWKQTVERLLADQPQTSNTAAVADEGRLAELLTLVEEVPLLTPYRGLVGRALDVLESSSDEGSEIAVRAALRRVELLLGGAGSNTASAPAERVRQQVGAFSDTMMKQRALLVGARASLVQNQANRAGSLLDEIRKPAAPQITAWIAVVRSMIQLMAMNVADANRTLRAALDVLAPLDQRVDDLRYFVLLNLGIVGGINGDPSAPLSEALALVQRHGAVAESVAIHGLLGPHFQARGDYVNAKAHLQQAIELARQVGMRKEAIGFRLVLGRARLAEGDRVQAREETMGLLDEIEAVGDMSAFFQATELMMDIFIAGEEYAAAYRICQTASHSVVRVLPLAVELLRRKLKVIEERMGREAYREMVDQVETALRASAHLRH